MAPRLEQVDIEYIPWATGQGHTQGQIAEHLDRSRRTVQKYSVGCVGRPPGRPCKLTAVQLAEVARMVPRVGYARTGRAIGESLQTVRNAAVRLGLRSPFKRGQYAR